MTELTSLYNQGIDLIEPSELTGSIKGRSNLYNHLESMIKNAKESVIISTTATGLDRKHKVLRETLLKAKQRGIKIRISAPSNKENQIFAEPWGVPLLLKKSKNPYLILYEKS